MLLIAFIKMHLMKQSIATQYQNVTYLFCLLNWLAWQYISWCFTICFQFYSYMYIFCVCDICFTILQIWSFLVHVLYLFFYFSLSKLTRTCKWIIQILYIILYYIIYVFNYWLILYKSWDSECGNWYRLLAYEQQFWKQSHQGFYI